MLTREVVISNKLGLHARAAAKLVKVASAYSSTIEIEKQDQRVNAKSIMSVMMLAVSRGNSITLYVSGDDQEEALASVIELIEARFGEDE